MNSLKHPILFNPFFNYLHLLLSSIYYWLRITFIRQSQIQMMSRLCNVYDIRLAYLFKNTTCSPGIQLTIWKYYVTNWSKVFSRIKTAKVIKNKIYLRYQTKLLVTVLPIWCIIKWCINKHRIFTVWSRHCQLITSQNVPTISI